MIGVTDSVRYISFTLFMGSIYCTDDNLVITIGENEQKQPEVKVSYGENIPQIMEADNMGNKTEEENVNEVATEGVIKEKNSLAKAELEPGANAKEDVTQQRTGVKAKPAEKSGPVARSFSPTGFALSSPALPPNPRSESGNGTGAGTERKKPSDMKSEVEAVGRTRAMGPRGWDYWSPGPLPYMMGASASAGGGLGGVSGADQEDPQCVSSQGSG